MPSCMPIRATVPRRAASRTCPRPSTRYPTTSWGFSPSVLYVYDAGILPQQGTYDVAGEEVELYFCAGEGLLRTVEAPPMMEGIDQFDGRLFLSNESASNKYLFGKLYGAGAVYWIEV